MNNDKVMRLAIDISSKPIPWNGEYTFRTKKELVAFANACEKIGMEKAAKPSLSLQPLTHCPFLPPENVQSV